MAITTTSVASFVNNQINAYRGLAQKATGTDETVDQNNSVVAALKQFFYKLDFLLKYGHFPSVEDTAQEALPKELRGLKAFLENLPNEGKIGDSYVLQRNDTERYRFSWLYNKKLTVTIEKFNVPMMAARSGYRSAGVWRVYTGPQKCEMNELLSLLKGKPHEEELQPHVDEASQPQPHEEFRLLKILPQPKKGKHMIYAGFCAKYNARNLLPPSQNQQPIFVKDKGMNFDGFIAAYQQSVENISKKPTSYVVWRPQTETESDFKTPDFKTCVADLHRAGNIQPRLSNIRLKLGFGVNITENMLKDIIKRIVPTYEPNENCSVINTSAFTSTEVEELLSSNKIISSKEINAIRNTLLHPQFPLALLAIVSRGCGGEIMTPLFVQQQEALKCLQDASFTIPDGYDFALKEYFISAIEASRPLYCVSTIYMPCVVGGDNSFVGVSKVCKEFTTHNYVGKGKEGHSESEIQEMLAPLSAHITTTITI